MKIIFSSQKINKQLNNASSIKKYFGTNAKRIAQRLDEIRACPSLSDLFKLPGSNCHSLIGNRKNSWSMHVSGNVRIIFKIEKTNLGDLENGALDMDNITVITITEIVDYH